MTTTETNSPLAQQDSHRGALVRADRAGDYHNCWAWIVIHESCAHFPSASRADSTVGTIMRLVSHRDGHYVFISFDKEYVTMQHHVYHLRGDKFFIKWAGQGDVCDRELYSRDL